jgi:asparagine synthase (glutamine-hydrolysing)
MCGIAGLLDLGNHPIDPAVLQRMCDRIAHRGPDAAGYHVRGPVGLGHRRLSIIDLSTGTQPMGNENGTVWVTFNGEIYNFNDLRRPLEACGHRFSTHSDTEVIVHAYEQYGRECVNHFRGMFAFAVWDERARQLFVARDRLGKKPLYYSIANGQFVFASELQGLLAHPDISRTIDPTAIDDYLTYGYIPAPKTIFRNVFKLPPAHTLTVEWPPSGNATVRTERYWQLAYGPKDNIDETQALEGLADVLTDAVRLRMIADVPLGALLSGGVDSGVIVALMSGLSPKPVKTFSIGFDEKAFNELPAARFVAERYRTDHHELIVRPDALEVLPTLVRHYGEPYADSSAIPSYYVAKMTREHVTVALNGDGGDECFAGYERYLGVLMGERYRRLPWLLRRGFIEPLSFLIPDYIPRRNRLRQAKRFLEGAHRSADELYAGWVSFFGPDRKRDLYSPTFQADLAGYSSNLWLSNLFGGAPEQSLDRVLAVDVESYLPYDLLTKMDIATMAHGLEARSPFLDHKVMEFAARLPANLKIRGRTLKYLLRKFATRYFPDEHLNRRKMGFGVPVGDWMRNQLRPLVEDTVLSDRAMNRGYFRPEAVRQLCREHFAGKDHSFPIWALLCLELWHREFVD